MNIQVYHNCSVLILRGYNTSLIKVQINPIEVISIHGNGNGNCHSKGFQSLCCLPRQKQTAKMAKFGPKICLFWCNFWLNLSKIMGLFNTIFLKNIFFTWNWPKIGQFQAHFQLNICPSLKINKQIHFILWKSPRKRSIFVFWLCRFCRFCRGKCVPICRLPRQRKLAAKRHVQAGFHSTVKN